MISVIIVNYKVPILLKKCIQAVKKTDYTNDFEIIVVDNASNDSSFSLISNTFEDIIWIQNDSNEGFAKAVNTGIQKAHGDLILLLNPDTEIFPQSLTVCEDFFALHPECGIIGGKIVSPDGSIQPQCRRRIPNPATAFFRLFGLTKIFPNHHLSSEYELPIEKSDSIHEIEAVSGALMCIRKQVLDHIGNMDGNFFLYGEDLDLCVRVTQANYKIFYVPDITAVHLRGASRKKRPIKTLWHIHQAMVRFFFKHQAKNHSIFLICIITCAIWLRWIGMTLIALTNNLTPQKKPNQ